VNNFATMQFYPEHKGTGYWQSFILSVTGGDMMMFCIQIEGIFCTILLNEKIKTEK
jgi:hypothetical protein